jgi:nitroreductase
MHTIEAIITRRSIRKFKDQPVEEEKQKIILRAGMQAPSARNTQPWHYIVIDDKSLLNRIATVHPYAKMLRETPLAIAVCGDLHMENSLEYLAVNCSAATQNILLAAHDLGLGAVWLGIYPQRERMRDLSDLLRLPGYVIPISLVAMGYPAEEVPKRNRFRKERIHRNWWVD